MVTCSTSDGYKWLTSLLHPPWATHSKLTFSYRLPNIHYTPKSENSQNHHCEFHKLYTPIIKSCITLKWKGPCSLTSSYHKRLTIAFWTTQSVRVCAMSKKRKTVSYIWSDRFKKSPKHHPRHARTNVNWCLDTPNRQPLRIEHGKFVPS